LNAPAIEISLYFTAESRDAREGGQRGASTSPTFHLGGAGGAKEPF